MFRGGVGWVAGLVILLCACAGDGPPPASTSADEFFARWVPVECDQEVRCGLSPDLQACLDSNHAPFLVQLRADLAAKKISYNGAAGAACLDALSKDSCKFTERLDAIDAACIPAFKGTVPAGGPCVNLFQCVSGNCVTSCNPADTCCMGKCSASPGNVGAGATCGGMTGSRCTLVTRCTATNPELGTCVPRTPDGGPCGNSGTCLPGRLCYRADANASMGVCRKWPGEGEPCGETACDLDDNYCEPVTKVCAKRLRPGAACDPNNPTSPCALFTFCDVATKTCVEPGRLNQPCSPRFTCLGDLSCQTKCVAPPDPPVCQ